MLVVALIGGADSSIEGANSQLLVALKGVIAVIGILHGRGTVVRLFVQTLEAFFCDLRMTMLNILQEFGPESLVGRGNLPFDTAGQLGRKAIADTKLSIHAFMQFGHIAGFALLERIATTPIERITISKLRLA